MASWERRSPAWIRRSQDRLLRAYVARDVYPFSALYRERFDRAGVSRRAVRSVDDLVRLPFTTSSDLLADPGRAVLRPDEATMRRWGGPAMLTRMAWAKLRGTQSLFNQHVIDPVYKPLLWLMPSGIPIGSSADDLDRLAELGRRWLEVAGLRRSDVVAGLLQPGLEVAYWQLVLGCQRAGLSAVHLGPGADAAVLAGLSPTVLVGEASDLERAITDRPGASTGWPTTLRTLLVTGGPLNPRRRARLRGLLSHPDAEVVAAWGARATRAIWTECRGGDALHTWPDAEVLSVVDPASGMPLPAGSVGEVVWSALGWKGSALLRYRTGGLAALEIDPCPTCGRTTPRLRPALPPTEQRPRPVQRRRPARAG